MERDRETPSSTLFIADIPDNLTELDLQQTFQGEDGYRSARLRKDRNGNLVGFVEFNDANSASRAKDRFSGHTFLLSENPVTIHFSHSSGGSGGSGGLGERRRTNKDHAPRHNRTHSGGNNASPLGQNVPSSANMPVVPPFYSAANPLASLTYPYQNTLFANLNTLNAFHQLPDEASSTLYVEGLPLDATEREVSHIFRQWPGFQSLRLLPKSKESQPNPVTGKFPSHPATHYHLCFIEFDNKNQSTLAMMHLNGYRFEKNDVKGLTISYAKTDRKDKKGLNNPRKKE